MPDILMPKLSDSMEQGTILSWLKAPGDRIEIGDELLEIETDKSTVTHVAEAAGVLEILADEGLTIAVGEPIARIGAGASAAETPPAPPPVTAIAAAPAAAAAGNGAHGNGRGAAATPIARRMAAAHGVALDAIRGTGPLGRVTRADVVARAGLSPADLPVLPTLTRAGVPGPTGPPAGIDGPASAPPASAPPASAPPLSALPPGGVRRREPSRLQQLIARRMAHATATIPHFQVQTEVVIDATIALRAELKALAGESETVPSINDIIIKAAALALREHPLANGSFQDDGFVLHEAINVGMAVAAQDALVVPTVFGADTKSIGQIARETRELAQRVRSGEISPAELEGGTFTVSNLGMFGMTAITPVINPPQAAILGVGGMRDTLARADGQIVDRTLLTLTLSCDHRILYGADAARFLARIRELLQAPLKLAL